MRNVPAIALGLLALAVAPAAAEAESLDVLRAIHAEGPASERGIGPVRLEQTEAAVTGAVGPGRLVAKGFAFGERFSEYDYRVGGIKLEVVFDSGLVSVISTSSPAARLFGHPLREGLGYFRRLLRHRRHWRVDTCHGRSYTALAPGGPGTGIEWRSGRASLVMVDVGGVLDDCALL